jgi:hypothetical protein
MRTDAPKLNPAKAIEAARQLKESIRAMLASEAEELTADDQEVARDTFDGATTLDAEIREAALMIQRNKAFATGCEAEIANLQKRKQRFEARVESLRGFVAQAMTVAEWRKHECDVATFSLKDARPRVIVDQESEIPSQFFKRQDPTLDKTGLNKVMLERHKAMCAALSIADDEERARRLEAIEQELPEIPGARIETGGHTLTLRFV